MSSDSWDIFDPLGNFDFDGDGEYNAIEKATILADEYEFYEELNEDDFEDDDDLFDEFDEDDMCFSGDKQYFYNNQNVIPAPKTNQSSNNATQPSKKEPYYGYLFIVLTFLAPVLGDIVFLLQKSLKFKANWAVIIIGFFLLLVFLVNCFLMKFDPDICDKFDAKIKAIKNKKSKK